VTTRGFGLAEVTDLAGWMCDLIDSRGDAAVLAEVKAKALALCARFPVYER